MLVVALFFAGLPRGATCIHSSFWWNRDQGVPRADNASGTMLRRGCDRYQHTAEGYTQLWRRSHLAHSTTGYLIVFEVQLISMQKKRFLKDTLQIQHAAL